VPRPEIIEELFGARYDWETAALNEKARMESRFLLLRSQAAQQYGCSEMALWNALRQSYITWRKQNNCRNHPENETPCAPRLMVKKETVSPRRFLTLAKEQAGNIQRVRIISPKLGDGHFGRLRIEYKKALVPKPK
jgi:hypothetical protein